MELKIEINSPRICLNKNNRLGYFCGQFNTLLEKDLCIAFLWWQILKSESTSFLDKNLQLRLSPLLEVFCYFHEMCLVPNI